MIDVAHYVSGCIAATLGVTTHDLLRVPVEALFTADELGAVEFVIDAVTNRVVEIDRPRPSSG